MAEAQYQAAVDGQEFAINDANSIGTVSGLADDPGKLPLVPISRAIVQAIVAAFTPSNAGYVYKLNGLAGLITGAHQAVQTVMFTAPLTEPQLPDNTGDTVQAWPATLTRYVVSPNTINLTFTGPV